MSEALRNLLSSNPDDSPEDDPSPSGSDDRSIQKAITRKISKSYSASTNLADTVKFTVVPQEDTSNCDDISIASEGGCDLEDLRHELSARLTNAGRRPSMTAPSSPTPARRVNNSPRRTHLPLPHFPHLPQIPHNLSHLLTWRDIKGRWGSGFLHRGNESLHRTESMVSLCFQTLSNFVLEDNLNGLQSFLGSKQIQIDDKDDNGTTALMLACQHGRTSMVSELLAHGADPNVEDNDLWTALLLAAKYGRINSCSDLLDHGANIHQRDMGGWTPLMWASYKGHEDVVNLMLEKGADVNAHGNYHISSLVWAAGRGHSRIVERLLAAGARPNSGDKYGTTALVWAARKGDAVAVKALLAAGATPDQAGMYSWTALLQATQGNRVEIVQMLLEHKPNVNALDKDGCTALAIACKEGYYDIAVALLNCGAYINIQDRGGDTCLIHAVKGGHRSVVEALLKKYADVDVLGKDRKTAVYTAVEKGHTAILKLLLQSNPDLELATKDGDTPLLRAVRSRNTDMVQLLLDKKARVNAADKKGDTCLHIAMRARSKAIVEILLRNPKNSQLLYRPNRAQETPYNIDMNYPKTILGQIFGARRLNTNEDNESLLGYELYSSALADMLSEPSLSMPITVGLYARWGSGKSFLLNKLREEMKNFAKQWIEVGWTWSWAVGWGVWHAAMLGGTIAMIAGASWVISLCLLAMLFVLLYVALVSLWYASRRYEWSWPYTVMLALSEKFNSLKLVLQVVFCHPPGPQCTHSLPAQPIRFHFTDQAKSSTQEGEASVIQMMVSLSEALENQYGRLCTRLYRAFRPKPIRATADWRWRRVCCIPHIFTFELCFIFVSFAICVLAHYLKDVESNERIKKIQEGVLLGLGAVLAIAAVANLYTWGRIGTSLFLSPRAHLKRSVNKQPEGFLQALRPEVTLLTDMVKCLDAFTGQQTRLVVVVDALDSCEQDRVLIVLNAIHTLCSEQHSPFVIILAIDPHIISKAVEVNSRRAFSESNIGGWDYLKNMVQLPFYLQNSALRRVKVAQQTALKKQQFSGGLSANDDLSTSLQRSVSARRLSSASELMSSQEKLKGLGGGGSSRGTRKLKISESVASSMNSNLHKVGLTSGPADLNRVLLTDDYFSDVNPRSMRRLMNVLYITGRLLKAFQIEFNWYHLASWVNLTEQWPFRTSWIILHHEMFEEHIDDSTPLKQIYDKVRPNIPIMREVEPLMELDRDERKLDVFLGFHRMSLLAADLKIFLPFTINLDPYIKKVIKDEQQHYIIDNSDTAMNPLTSQKPYNSKVFGQRKHPRPPTLPPIYGGGTPGAWPGWPDASPQQPVHPTSPVISAASPPVSFSYSQLNSELSDVRLSKLNISGVCAMIERELSQAAPALCPTLKRHNVSGKVLRHCDLNELKQILNLNFGDWELFKILILGLREVENGLPPPSAHVILPEKDRSEKDGGKLRPSQDTPKSRPSNMEKQKFGQEYQEYQVTLEEQMICGALQTLNEEALEDVLGGETTVPQVSDESEALQLVLLGPSSGWQATSPPPSLTASPQMPRKVDPSILKPKGSFKQPTTSKKHVSINDRGVSFGSDSSLKYNDLTPVVVRFEDETIKYNTQQYYTTQQHQPKCDNVFDFDKMARSNNVEAGLSNNRSNRNDSTWASSNRTDMDKANVTSQDVVDSHKAAERLRKKSLPTERSEDCSGHTGRRHSSTSRKRPSSLLLSKHDEMSLQIEKEISSVRSRSAEDSSPKVEVPIDITDESKLKHQTLAPENNTQTSSVEIINRLRDKIFNKCPSIDRGSKSGDMESDDESTPLVSSERSSPSISLKAQRDVKEERKSSAKHCNTSSSSDNNSSKGNSPMKVERKRKTNDMNQAQKVFSPDRHDNISDATISVEFSPCSDHSSGDSNVFNPLDEGKCNIKFHDTQPVDNEIRVRESSSKKSDTASLRRSYVSNSGSVESLSYLLEPQSLNVLSNASSESSIRSANLFRQDAVEDQEWKNPESKL